jgi:hypothetical protein
VKWGFGARISVPVAAVKKIRQKLCEHNEIARKTRVGASERFAPGFCMRNGRKRIQNRVCRTG